MISQFELQPLPFSGSPHIGESGHGFLLRMAERNGIRLHEFFAILTLNRRRRFKPEDAPALARLFDCGASDIVPLFVTSGYGQYCVRRFNFYGYQVTRFYFLDQKHPKVCPRCLAEFGYANAIWDLSLFLWCPVHECALIDRCPACDRELSWFRPGIATCTCGGDLKSCIDRSALPWSAMALAVVLSRAMNDGCGQNLKYPAEYKATISVLSVLSLDGVMRLIWVLGVGGDSARGIGMGRKRRSIAETALIINAGFLKLQALLWDISTPLYSETREPVTKLLIHALRRMVDDGATEGDRHFAQTCIDAVLFGHPHSGGKSRRKTADQLSLSFDEESH